VDRKGIKGLKLSDYVKIEQPDNESMTLKVFSKYNRTEIYTINGFLLADHFQYVDARLHTSENTKFKGVQGLSDQVGSSLWLADGVYSLWARDEGDPV